MPKIYTRQEKKHAMYLMEQLGSIDAVYKQTGIPQRTLRDWRELYNRGFLVAEKHPTTRYNGNPNSIRIQEIRDRLFDQIAELTKTPTSDPRQAYYAALAIDRILEQIRSLNAAIGIEITANNKTADNRKSRQKPPQPAPTDQ